jgi:hypothetical protein
MAVDQAVGRHERLFARRLPRTRFNPRAPLAVVGLTGAIGVCAWLALAAAARPSVLSPPTLRASGHWLLGPLAGVLGSITNNPPRLHDELAVALVALFAAWLLAWATAGALPLRVVGAGVGLAQLVVVLGPPQPLTDVFNYVVYGRMAADGPNPYTHAPAAGVHNAAYALSNWHHLPSPYGPLFTLLSEPLGLMSAPAALWVWKALALGCSLGILALVASIARTLERSPQRAIACVGLCPVTLAYGLGGLHNDVPALLCLLGAVACVLRGARDATGASGARWDGAAGALAVAAAGLKPSFGVVAPLIVLGAQQRLAALAGAAAAGAAVLALVTALFAGALPALGLQGRLVSPLSIPNLAGVALGHGGADAGVRAAARDVLLVGVAAAAGAVWRDRRLLLPALALVLLGAVLSLGWVMPWYLGWSLPFIALARSRALVVVAVVACVWLGVGGSSQLPTLLHHVGYFPTRLATGLANHNFEVELVQ